MSKDLTWKPIVRDRKGELRLDEAALRRPFGWRGTRKATIGADLFAADVPDEWIEHVLAVAALCPKHSFAVPTADSERAERLLGEFEAQGPYIISKVRAHAWRDPRDGTRLYFEKGAAWPPANVKLEQQADA